MYEYRYRYICIYWTYFSIKLTEAAAETFPDLRGFDLVQSVFRTYSTTNIRIRTMRDDHHLQPSNQSLYPVGYVCRYTTYIRVTQMLFTVNKTNHNDTMLQKSNVKTKRARRTPLTYVHVYSTPLENMSFNQPAGHTHSCLTHFSNSIQTNL